MNFISRESVLALLDEYHHGGAMTMLRAQIERLPSFPSPNPDWEWGIADRNVMGQTENQFWDAVDKQ